MLETLEGRVVAVTGAMGALGRAVVRRLLAAGATVHGVDLAEPSSLQVPMPDDPRLTLRGGVDLTDEAAVVAVYAGIDDLFASVHVAGGFAMAPIADITLSDFDHMMRMNTTTCFLACREAVKAIRRGGSDGGRLVNVAARPALHPAGGMTAYVASKAAVAGLTTGLAEELAGEGIWVNAVVPSIIDTPANRAGMPDADHSAWPSTDALAETIAFLASPANKATRGGLVPVYGRS
jgi:NAD(P)-dependent dehydrogenase (short-subunit alcohol dehydrogenase family)